MNRLFWSVASFFLIDHYRCIIIGREPEIDGASGGDALTDEFRRLTRQRENKKVDSFGFWTKKKRNILAKMVRSNKWLFPVVYDWKCSDIWTMDETKQAENSAFTD